MVLYHLDTEQNSLPLDSCVISKPIKHQCDRIDFLEHAYLLYCPEESNLKINERSVHLCVYVGGLWVRREKDKVKEKRNKRIMNTIPLGRCVA